MMKIHQVVLLALTILIAACASSQEPRLDDANDIEVTGLLRTGVMTAAGETTGVAVAGYDGLQYELVLDDEDRSYASKLDGQHVYVAGGVHSAETIDGRVRLILDVKRISHRPLK